MPKRRRIFDETDQFVEKVDGRSKLNKRGKTPQNPKNIYSIKTMITIISLFQTHSFTGEGLLDWLERDIKLAN